MTNIAQKMFPKYYNHKFLKKNKIEFRKYQVNISKQTFKSNSLIVLPTALGKTIIGIILAAKYLEEFKKSKVLVLAPTKPLVLQHYRMFREFFIDTINMDTMIGNKPPLKRALTVLNNDILFSTPQIIKNDLTLGSYTLKDFSLIIFDEAHRARKNYAYTFVAEEYMNTAKKPYILGLTASPGKDKEVINALIEKLRIERVCFKHEEDVDVKEYIYEIDTEIERIELPYEVYKVQMALNERIDEIIEYFVGKNILPAKNYYSKVDFIRLNQDIHAYNLYGEDYEEYNFKNVPLILGDNPIERFTYISLCITGIYLMHMEEILTCQTPLMFYNYYEKLRERAENGSNSAKRIINSKHFISKIKPLLPILKNLKSPKINRVLKIIKHQFTKKKDSKIIVFTQFRDMGTILKDEIDKLNDADIRCDRFVGQFSKIGDKGLTQKMQQEMIDQFRTKNINVLIATSIAEEGLDIPNVDLVIFYEPVPSEIRLIQRRGRTGRHSRGKCIMLCATDTLDEIYLEVAFRKEKKMKEILIMEKDLELFDNIKRNPQAFEPEKVSEEEIYKFFKDIEERKKISIKKEIDMVKSVVNSNVEKQRKEELEKYGIRDLTTEIGNISLKRLELVQKNREEIKKQKIEEYYRRRKEKMMQKYKNKKIA